LPRNPQNPENTDSAATRLQGTVAPDRNSATNPEESTILPTESATSSTGIAFEQDTSVPQPAARTSDPTSAGELGGAEKNQAYASASAAAINPTADFTGLDFGSTGWDAFMHASGNAGLDPTLFAGDDVDPCVGFDIPFWLGQDQYWDMLNERS
jgi:hypothetical protein